MIYIEKTTARDRETIYNAVYPIMDTVEIAMKELSDLESEFFEAKEQAALNKNDTKKIGRTIRVASELLYDACAAFGVLVDIEEFSGVPVYNQNMKRIQEAQAVNALRNKMINAEMNANPEKRKALSCICQQLSDMDDEQARPILMALLKEI